MRLLIKKKFSWKDKYDVYDETGNKKYYVEGETFSLGLKIHVYDMNRFEIGKISRKSLAFSPRFEVEIGGRIVATILKKTNFLNSEYVVDYRNWYVKCVKRDSINCKFEVYSGNYNVANITKELISTEDTCIIDIFDPNDEIMGLMLVLAIDLTTSNSDND